MQVVLFKYEYDDGFSNITTLDFDDQIWFAVPDVCKALELSNPTEAIKGLDDDEKLTSVILRAGQNRNVNFINESGLYTLIFKSRKPSALQFRKWVTKEVIPSIRKKGFYGKIDRNQVPDFYKRYRENFHKIDHNYFSVISELFVTLNAELERVGYQIPNQGQDGRLISPDISVGQLFSKYLSVKCPDLIVNYKTYKHSFPDDRPDVDARMYPIDLLPTFRKFIYEVWIPERSQLYFEHRDPKALEYLPKLLV